LKFNEKRKLLIMYYLIVGPTCTGKDKVANYIVENFDGLKTITSTTSRPIRPKEKNGREYYFITSEEFEKILSEDGFVEYRVYNTTVKGVSNTWYYGIEKSKVSDEDTDYVVVLDYKGAMDFAEYFGREKCILIYVQSPYEQRYIRNILRGDFDETEWLRRNKEDAKWLLSAIESSNLIIENHGFVYPENPNADDDPIDIRACEKPKDFSDTIKQIEVLLGRPSKENKDK
jgi:guanylate kinase